MSKAVIYDLLKIFKVSVAAVLPENLIRRTLQYNPASKQLNVCGDTYNLIDKNVYVVGTGKAVRNMAIEVENILDSKIKQGIISVPEGSLKVESKIISYQQGAKNNLPDQNSEQTTRKINELVSNLKIQDFLIVLISGGGSALLSLSKPPISLEEKTSLIKKLANSGADIKELNIVRKKLSHIKGGKLAIKAYPAQIISLILSDIVGDPIDLIASGPTVENTDDPNKALDIVSKYGLFNELPISIKTILEEKSESNPFPKENVKNHVIGSNKLSIKAAMEEAKKLDYTAIELSNMITGNVKDIAKDYARLTEGICNFIKGNIDGDALRICCQALNISGISKEFNNEIKNKDICLVLGGEPTIEVKGTGKGGRNQQLALEFSKNIHSLREKIVGFDIYFLSAGTDGIDGPTDAAGAIGYLNLISDSVKENLNVDSFLDNNDSYNFYKQFKSGELHVVTGHTNTNVMDIHLIVIKRKE